MQGWHLKSTTECAGFGGDAKHLSFTGQAQWHTTLKVDSLLRSRTGLSLPNGTIAANSSPDDSLPPQRPLSVDPTDFTDPALALFPFPVLSLHGRVGLLQPFFGSTSHISDRFFLGGPEPLRGFAGAGVGPRSSARPAGGPSSGDALGGNVKCSGAAIVSLPIRWPKALEETGLRATFTLSGGTVEARDPLTCIHDGWVGAGPRAQDSPGSGVAGSMRNLMRGAATVGIAIPLQGMHLEICASSILASQPHDRPHIWQIGMNLGVGCE